MRNSIMKTIEVAAAVIVDSFENTTAVFATERGYGEFKGQWEFPGGKIEVGETPQQALIREIQEELTVKIKVGKLIDTIEYDYPKFHLNMKCFLCVIVDGDIILKENKDELYGVNWLPADITLIDEIADFMNN